MGRMHAVKRNKIIKKTFTSKYYQIKRSDKKQRLFAFGI